MRPRSVHGLLSSPAHVPNAHTAHWMSKGLLLLSCLSVWIISQKGVA